MNTSDNATAPPAAASSSTPAFMLAYWYLYVLIGGPLMFVNTFGLFVMMKRKSARVGSLFFVAMNLGDLISSISFCALGVMRLWYTLRDQQNMVTTRAACCIIYVVPWIVGLQLTYIVLVISNMDR